MGTDADTALVWSGWLMLMELDGSNNAVRSYTCGLDLAGQNGLVNDLQSAGGIGGVLAVHDASSSEDYVYCYDANGNVGQMIAWEAGYGNATGDGWHSDRLVARYEYDPYGAIVGPDTDDDGDFDEYDEPGTYAAANPIRFSTKYWDDETGLGYWGHRYYNPRLGRWMNRDPIGEKGAIMVRGYAGNLARSLIPRDRVTDQMHAYVYVRNRPVSSIDSLGLCQRDDLLTDWKVCCSKVDEQQYGAVAGLATHCALSQGACSEGETGFNVWLDGSCDRKMDNGTPCCCASLDDVGECLKRNPYSAKPLGPDAGGAKCVGGEWGNNCQTSTIIQLGKCCLRSNWAPAIYAGNPRRYCKRGHYEWIADIDMAHLAWICDEWVDLPEWRNKWDCIRGHWKLECFDGPLGTFGCRRTWVCDEWGWVRM